MATLDNDDLKAIKNLIEVTIDEKVEDGTLVSNEKLNHLPTKEEFYDQNDKLMKELKAIREEQPILSKQLSNHSDRIEKLEKIHPHYQHQRVS